MIEWNSLYNIFIKINYFLFALILFINVCCLLDANYFQISLILFINVCCLLDANYFQGIKFLAHVHANVWIRRPFQTILYTFRRLWRFDGKTLSFQFIKLSHLSLFQLKWSHGLKCFRAKMCIVRMCLLLSLPLYECLNKEFTDWTPSHHR